MPPKRKAASNKPGGKPGSATPNPPAPEYPATEQGLTEAFFDTDEVNAYIAATDKIRKAMDRGDPEVSLPTEFLYNAISNTLSFTDPKIVAAWNRACDLVGLPEKKQGVEGFTGADMFAHRNITVGHALRFKTSRKEEGEGGEGGPF